MKMKVAGRQAARKPMVRRQANKRKKTRMQGDTSTVAREISGHDSDGEPCRWPHVLVRINMHGHGARVARYLDGLNARVCNIIALMQRCMNAVPGG